VRVEHFIDVVEPGGAAGQNLPFTNGLEVKFALRHWHGIADDLLDDVGQRHDAFDAAVLIDDERESLRVREKAAQQFNRLHRLRDEGRRGKSLLVRRRRIE
jgi:hypothetical protein